MDASNLKPGHRLLSVDGAASSRADTRWSEVIAVDIEEKPLKAYNITVADWHTFFVRGAANDESAPVWVHNACDPSKLAHIFGQARHQLGPLLSKFGGSQQSAFNAVQSAANAELAAGRLVVGPNGVLPSAGNVLNVGGVPVQLSGGRVINGGVSIGSFSGVIRLP